MNFFVEYKNEFGSREEFNNFVELIKKIWEINEEAAIKMTEPSEAIFPHFSYSGDLSECFMWDRTSEGHDYWYSIFDIIHPIDEEEEDIEF
jgi:hypothetical protein